MKKVLPWIAGNGRLHDIVAHSRSTARYRRERIQTVPESAIRPRFVRVSFHSLNTALSGLSHRLSRTHCGTEARREQNLRLKRERPDRIRRTGSMLGNAVRTERVVAPRGRVGGLLAPSTWPVVRCWGLGRRKFP